MEVLYLPSRESEEVNTGDGYNISRPSKKRGIAMLSSANDIKGPTIERQIGGTKFIVTSAFSRKATETAVQKMRRLILKDAKKVMESEK